MFLRTCLSFCSPHYALFLDNIIHNKGLFYQLCPLMTQIIVFRLVSPTGDWVWWPAPHRNLLWISHHQLSPNQNQTGLSSSPLSKPVLPVVWRLVNAIFFIVDQAREKGTMASIPYLWHLFGPQCLLNLSPLFFPLSLCCMDFCKSSTSWFFYI